MNLHTIEFLRRPSQLSGNTWNYHCSGRSRITLPPLDPHLRLLYQKSTHILFQHTIYLQFIGMHTKYTQCTLTYLELWVWVMMLNATFNNISATPWQSVVMLGKPVYPVKTTDLLQVTNELYHIMLILFSSFIYSLSHLQNV